MTISATQRKWLFILALPVWLPYKLAHVGIVFTWEMGKVVVEYWQAKMNNQLGK